MSTPKTKPEYQILGKEFGDDWHRFSTNPSYKRYSEDLESVKLLPPGIDRYNLITNGIDTSLNEELSKSNPEFLEYLKIILKDGKTSISYMLAYFLLHKNLEFKSDDDETE